MYSSPRHQLRKILCRGKRLFGNDVIKLRTSPSRVDQSVTHKLERRTVSQFLRNSNSSRLFLHAPQGWSVRRAAMTCSVTADYNWRPRKNFMPCCTTAQTWHTNTEAEVASRSSNRELSPNHTYSERLPFERVNLHAIVLFLLFASALKAGYASTLYVWRRPQIQPAPPRIHNLCHWTV